MWPTIARDHDVADDDRPEQRADAVQHDRRELVAEERDGVRLGEQDDAAERHAAEAEGEAAERHHLADLQRRQSPMGIEPVAHRRAGHRGEARDCATARRRRTRRTRRGVADRLARVDRAEPVVEGQDAVREDRPGERDQQRAVGDLLQRVLDVRDLEVAELALHHVDRADQKRDAEQRRRVPRQSLDVSSQRRVPAPIRRRRPGARARPRSARSSPRTPYSATNWPKRGPSVWPSSTW